jgi:hypothetical protein
VELIDLHLHTTASDGALAPAELVAAAAAAGLKAAAVTDHDTVDGVAEAREAARGLELEVVAGVEISLEAGFAGGMHLLGLWVRPESPALVRALAWLQEARARRNPLIAARLAELGFPVSMEEVSAVAGGGQVGRPHFARALVAAGAVSTVGEAFNRLLQAGGPAYVAKERLSPEEGIRVVRAAGGVPVLAHPGLLPVRGAELEALARRLRGLGLEGLEAHYTDHDTATQRHLASLAARLGLAVSGGSDFHGPNKPEILLGRGRGGLRVPASLLAALKQRRDRLRREEGLA